MNKRKIVVGASLVLEDHILEDKALVFSDRVEGILDPEEAMRLEGEVLTFQGHVVPGFIDTHIHGAGGHDVMDGTPQALEAISGILPSSGTTAYLATTMTKAQEEILAALGNVRSFMDRQEREFLGAQVLGVHLEGPFLNPEYKGAQDGAFLQKPSMEWVGDWLDILRMITLAPEMDEGFRFIRSMAGKGAVLSIGHSGSSYETALAAYEEGVRHITHCFNAMTGLHHRKPGVVGAALAKPFTVEVIADGIHVHPGFLEAFIRLKTVDKVLLVTDAMRAAFLGEGTYDLGGQTVHVRDGACRLEDGTLAGSVLRTDTALGNMRRHTGFHLEEIVRMLSLNPARKLGIDGRKGSIAPGKDADLVFLDRDLQVREVYIQGRKAHSREERT
ncbi:N-acetylglucosamine-6-phosphate deacetylase [Anaerotalea alkaliphila]|uniref:N-acetylglucosamine-6-phosphate deacetylase n=1 Tax=Anaerotalea alkaliphila TaxID=2662126 RepID=A0A7X5HX72_9FIRM|nr:N-acetylglucosamine-6-phosphate deacetylase [Anaerotalea alkaliphila]NDL68271.1 N-acetylglucosamine-6-phosphate deacetylase [Anaerotalea alkaliphila]